MEAVTEMVEALKSKPHPPPPQNRRAGAGQGRHRLDEALHPAGDPDDHSGVARFTAAWYAPKHAVVLTQVWPSSAYLDSVGGVRLLAGVRRRGGLNWAIGTCRRCSCRITADSTAATFTDGVVIPELVFVAFQLTFAAITVALIVGASRAGEVLRPDGIRRAVVSPSPTCRSRTWCGNRRLPVRKRATSTSRRHRGAPSMPVLPRCGRHRAGQRIGYGRDAMPPHSLPMTMNRRLAAVGGWFGFKRRLQPRSHRCAALAFLNTSLPPLRRAWLGCWPSGCCAASHRCWVWHPRGGSLVAVTPAQAWSPRMGAIALGAVAGVVTCGV